MEDLILVLEAYLKQLDGSNINPVTEEDTMYSHCTFTVQGFDYQQNSLKILGLRQEDYSSEDETIEFEVGLEAKCHILLEGDDFSEASHDSEDDEWYGVQTVSEEHIYKVSTELHARLNLENNLFEILEPINTISIDIDVNEDIEE